MPTVDIDSQFRVVLEAFEIIKNSESTYNDAREQLGKSIHHILSDAIGFNSKGPDRTTILPTNYHLIKVLYRLNLDDAKKVIEVLALGSKAGNTPQEVIGDIKGNALREIIGDIEGLLLCIKHLEAPKCLSIIQNLNKTGHLEEIILNKDQLDKLRNAYDGPAAELDKELDALVNGGRPAQASFRTFNP
jgi:hypothetical protein